MRYVPRAARGRLARLLRDLPGVLVHGPRQCGKSTRGTIDLPL
jgi:predicted AAA+ superfamily ATPase